MAKVAVVAQEQRVAVGLRAGGRLGSDIGAGAGLVLDDELLPELLAHGGEDETREEIRPAAGRIGNDHRDRPCRIGGLGKGPHGDRAEAAEAAAMVVRRLRRVWLMAFSRTSVRYGFGVRQQIAGRSTRTRVEQANLPDFTAKPEHEAIPCILSWSNRGFAEQER